MSKAKAIKLMRDQIDKKLKQLKTTAVPPPKTGWIRTIRKALGLSQASLAHKLGITPQSLVDIEKNEQSGKVSLQTLKRVADVLDCDVHYSIVPRKSLEQKVRDQALTAAKEIVGRTQLHMTLEDQRTNNKFQETRIKELAEELIRNNDKKIWEIK